MKADPDFFDKNLGRIFRHKTTGLEMALFVECSNIDHITLHRWIDGELGGDPLGGFRWSGTQQELAWYWVATDLFKKMTDKALGVFFEGKGLISRAVQIQTRSRVSHVGIWLDGKLWESWHRGGVRNDRPLEGDYWLADIDAPYDVVRLRHFLSQQLGKGYDWSSVLRFISRRSAEVNNRFMCSELFVAAFRYAGANLLNIEAHHASPRDCSISPLVVRKGLPVGTPPLSLV